MSGLLPTVAAYCGLPAAPAEIWSRWRLDPIVVSILVLWLALYIRGALTLRASRRGGATGGSTREIVFFCSGWTIAAFAIVSPLCALSVSLFAARATQHVLLTLLAAPLVVAGSPVSTLMAGCGLGSRKMGSPRWLENPLLASAVFALFVWFWHAPVPYEATFASVALYWTMHITLFGSACWLWSTLMRTETALIGGLLASVASSVQMGLLGALITLSPRPFYAPHFLTTDAWGMTPLQDQQLGGVIMWVPGCTAFLIVAISALNACLARGRGGVRHVPPEGAAS